MLALAYASIAMSSTEHLAITIAVLAIGFTTGSRR